MFDESLIVTTALSSFNNAALYGPYFFVIGLLSIPLLLMGCVYGRDFVSKIGWSKNNIESQTGFWSVAVLVFWLVLFGGNYAVIRDGISLLPWGIAFVLFMSAMYLTNRVKFFGYMNKIQNKKIKWLALFICMVSLGLSAMPTWWGVLLQIGAVLIGCIIGVKFNIKFSDIVFPVFIYGFMTVLILMQPEYFRFAQLGNLTLVHILGLLMCGFFCVTTLVTKYTNARSKIYNSAYIKLKWLFRISAILALILFVVTESIPVFLGALGACGISQMLTIYHGKHEMKNMSKQSWAMFLVMFGVIIICPLISVLGIIYLSFLPDKINHKDFLKLL